jgi:nucleoside 2-deoxyribosyltransferase
MNILNKTRTYLVGGMQYCDGISWRDKITPELEKMGVIVYNPYKKPFFKDIQETPQVLEELKIQLQNKNYDYMNLKMREIRSFDLNLVDRSDFIIAHINPMVASWGSAEELVTAVKMKKAIFLSIENGKQNCPFWIFGMIPHKYIYNSIDEILKVLKRIDSGKKKIDSNRWRLLKECYR